MIKLIFSAIFAISTGSKTDVKKINKNIKRKVHFGAKTQNLIATELNLVLTILVLGAKQIEAAEENLNLFTCVYSYQFVLALET